MHPTVPPSPTDAIQQRLTDLEVKATYTEDLLEQLDQIVIRQQAQIDLLLREVAQLRDQAPQDAQATPRNLRDDLPPHF
jgi:SlyX protein